MSRLVRVRRPIVLKWTPAYGGIEENERAG